MSMYYLNEGEHNLGPFNIEELKNRNITKETFIWKEGSEQWVMAKDMIELSTLFNTVPPPLNKEMFLKTPQQDIGHQKTNKKRTVLGQSLKVLGISTIIIFFLGIFIYNQSSSENEGGNSFMSSEKTPEELRMELKMIEKLDPAAYLKKEITMRGNFLGEKVFEGTISNSATMATFKDIVIEITFYSKTETIIGQKSITIYEIIGPKRTIEIDKVKLYAPDETEAVGTRIVSAIPLE